MYRQARIHENDRNLQRILWRRSADEVLRTYVLSTVMYGTASPPCLATRCLQRLEEDVTKGFSLAPELLTKNVYVDDALCGVKTIEVALRLPQNSSRSWDEGDFTYASFVPAAPAY